MLVVAALGDGALRPSAEPLGPDEQAARVDEAARYLSAIADEHHLVVTHGFGPCDFVDAGGWIRGVGRLPEAEDMLRAGPGVVTPGDDTGAPAAIAGA